MKKIALGILIALIAAAPASAKHKRVKRVKAEPTFAELNDNGYRLVRDSMPVYYPTIVKAMIYGPTTPSR